jgi:hypothetical protein
MPEQPGELARAKSDMRRNAAARLTEVVGAPALKRAQEFVRQNEMTNPVLAAEVRILTDALFPKTPGN